MDATNGFAQSAFCSVALYGISHLSSCNKADPRVTFDADGLENQERTLPMPDSVAVDRRKARGRPKGREALPRQRVPDGPWSGDA